MSTVLSTYCVEELIGWVNTINFYCNEIDDLKEKLAMMLNTAPATVKIKGHEHMDALTGTAARFSKLQIEMFAQEKIFQSDNGSLVSDSLVNEETVISQAILRLNVQGAEKEYIDVKFGCYQFIATELLKQPPVI